MRRARRSAWPSPIDCPTVADGERRQPALDLARLFSAGTGFWSIGANLAQPIFDGGTLLHRERIARANYDQAGAQYRSTVLVAFQTVSDALTAIAADEQAFGRVACG